MIAASLNVGSTVASAQAASESPNDSQAEFWPVRGGVYMLAGYGGNITASVGVDGVLLVDSGATQSSETVLAALQRLEERIAPVLQARAVLDESRAPVAASSVQYVINTGPRLDHTGGNATIGDASAQAARLVIAHENAVLHLVDRGELLETLPTQTIGSGEYDLTTRFNGEAIRLAHMPAATTDGDLIVYFRESDVISTGDVFSLSAFPVIDVERGGSIDGCIRALNYILALAVSGSGLDDGTLIVPGHGRLADVADVGRYRDMLAIIRDQVRHLIDSGLTLEEVQAQRPALGYEGRFGGRSGSGETERFVETVYWSLIRGRR